MRTCPAVKTGLLFIVGTVIGSECPFHCSWWLWLPAILISGAGILAFVNWNTGLRQGLLAVALILLGWLRISMTTWVPGNHVSNCLNREGITIKAHLTGDPEIRDIKTVLRFGTDSILTEQGFIKGRGKFILNRYQQDCDSLKYGDQILLKGQLVLPSARRNPGGFDYRAYLKTRNITGLFILSKNFPPVRTGFRKGNPVLHRAVYPLRRQIARILNHHYTGQSRALLKALILGDRTDISDENREFFQRIGIIHILAVSGLHVGFVLVLLKTLFGLLRIPGSWQAFLIIFFLILFCLITQSKPPVIRATLMASLYLIGLTIERQPDPFNTLGVTGLILLIRNPLMLFDTGFQLSFSAVFSILYLYPKWKHLPGFRQCHSWCMRHRLFKNIWPLWLVSLSAQLGTLPVVIVAFNRIPIIGPLSNLFAIPVTGLIVVYGFISLIFAPFSQWIAAVFASLTSVLVHLLYEAAKLFNAFPLASTTLPAPHPAHLLLYICVLLLWIHWTSCVHRRRFILAGMLLLNWTVWHAVFNSPATRLTYVQLDVGQGDSAVLHIPKRRTLIIDGGDRKPGFDAGKNVLIPYLRHHGIRHIDTVILTHAHNDHIGGLIAVAAAFSIRQILMSDTLSRSGAMREFLNIIKKRHIPVRIITAPDSLKFPGVICYFLSPEQSMQRHNNWNNRSLVMQLVFGRHRFLCMGDAEHEVEDLLIRQYPSLSADVIKVGHHGSGSSTGDRFLNHIHPEHAMISVGRKNRFGHPDSSVIKRLKNAGTAVYRTDQDGAVLIESDGKQLRLKIWK